MLVCCCLVRRDRPVRLVIWGLSCDVEGGGHCMRVLGMLFPGVYLSFSLLKSSIRIIS
jgi:hypothetical protein